MGPHDRHRKAGRLLRVAAGRFDALFETGVVAALRSDPDLVVRAVGVPFDAMRDLVRREHVAVALLDAHAFDTSSELLAAVRRLAPAGVVTFADPVLEPEIAGRLATSNGSCLPTDCAVDTLLRTVHLAAEGLCVRCVPSRPPGAERFPRLRGV